MSSRAVRFIAACFLSASALAACSSEDPPAPFNDVDVQGTGVNPEGLAYPTEDFGARPRKGDVPGQRIPNFSFQGYPNSDRSGGLKVVSMADFYDPSGERGKVLHLMAAVAWCPHCAAATDELVAVLPQLQPRGVVALQTLMEGYEGNPISLAELDQWVVSHKTSFTVVFDAGGRRLSTVADVSAVPWNALIDLRSMEVLSVVQGQMEDYQAWVGGALEWVEKNPARE